MKIIMMLVVKIDIDETASVVLSANNAAQLEKLIKENQNPHYQDHVHSLFKIKAHVEETANKIQKSGVRRSELTDLELAYLIQAEEFGKLKP